MAGERDNRRMSRKGEKSGVSSNNGGGMENRPGGKKKVEG